MNRRGVTFIYVIMADLRSSFNLRVSGALTQEGVVRLLAPCRPAKGFESPYVGCYEFSNTL